MKVSHDNRDRSFVEDTLRQKPRYIEQLETRRRAPRKRDSIRRLGNPGLGELAILMRALTGETEFHLMWQRRKQPEAGPLLPQSG
jgi:hypothetical protein